jgi:hypothetical protein
MWRVGPPPQARVSSGGHGWSPARVSWGPVSAAGRSVSRMVRPTTRSCPCASYRPRMSADGWCSRR